MFEIIRTENFIKKGRNFFKKHPELVNKFKELVEKLENNPFDSFLRTHKLKGRMKDFYACSINYEYRIILVIVVRDQEIFLVDIGSHKKVYQNKQ